MRLLLTGVAEKMQPMYGHHRECEGPPGGRGEQERVHPVGGDRPGAESRGEQAGSGRTQAGEEAEEEEGEAGEGTEAEGWRRTNKVSRRHGDRCRHGELSVHYLCT